MACAPPTRSADPSNAPATALATSPNPATTPIPSSPTTFDIGRVAGTFPAVTALISTGERIFWASEASIWAFTPGDAAAELIYENPARGALVWDLAAVGDALAFSERLAKPAGAWRVALLAGRAEEPVELDAGIAEHGAPPTLGMDEQRVAWAGFDEGTGTPRSFLRVVDRTDLTSIRTLLDAKIDERLLWYPELDDDTLWYGTIDPDFEAAGVDDAIHIETIDLGDPSSTPHRLDEPGSIFEPVTTAEYVAWTVVDPGFSALNWGEIHVRDRETGEQLVVATSAKHASIGSRFVTYEEFFHQQLLLYDFAARRTIEIPDPLDGRKGTLGIPSIAGNLLAYSTSVRGEKTVCWIRLPD